MEQHIGSMSCKENTILDMQEARRRSRTIAHCGVASHSRQSIATLGAGCSTQTNGRTVAALLRARAAKNRCNAESWRKSISPPCPHIRSHLSLFWCCCRCCGCCWLLPGESLFKLGGGCGGGVVQLNIEHPQLRFRSLQRRRVQTQGKTASVQHRDLCNS